MSTKLLFASAVMAAGSFMFIDTADAQRRGGAERGGNGSVEATGARRNGARQGRTGRRAGEARGQRRNGQRNQARTERAAPRADRSARAAAPRDTARQGARQGRQGRNADRPRRDFGMRHSLRRGWRQARRWAARRWHARPYFADRACHAVARRAGGYGRRIRGIYGDGYGRRACRKALNRCNDRLDYRQAQGRNPYARCVVASR